MLKAQNHRIIELLKLEKTSEIAQGGFVSTHQSPGAPRRKTGEESFAKYFLKDIFPQLSIFLIHFSPFSE